MFFSQFRHILAAIHFNVNLNRDNRIKKSDGSEQVAVVYPKFKNGEATVRGVKVEADFCKLLTGIANFIKSSFKASMPQLNYLNLPSQYYSTWQKFQCIILLILFMNVMSKRYTSHFLTAKRTIIWRKG